MDTKHIHIRDYDYPLPDERIAKFPLPERDSSKLLVYKDGHISETVFRSLPSLLPEGALMVFNNTKVIQARLHFRKNGDGALIEIFLLEPADPVEYQENFARRGSCSWYCLVGNLKKWKEGALTKEFIIHNSKFIISATRKGSHGTSQLIEFEWKLEGNSDSSLTWAEVIDAIGELPIPPYLNRKTQESDKTTYQTVYSKIKGSVAAPTAGLHFTERVLADIDARGIEREEVTLHVGAGTFRPVKSEDIGGHDMHTEHIAVHRRTIERLLAHGGQAIAVGTTSVRTLESLYYMGVLAYGNSNSSLFTLHSSLSPLHVPQWMPYEYDNSLSTTEALTALLHYMDEQGEDVLHSSTQIIIAPGYKYHIVRQMITNFHQPQSTLLLLVSAFIGDAWHDVYDYALSHDFRFLSYGDSSLLSLS
ncbi:MAG: S-adenosylmethionine:tRNA ribosyltransferase-isomerase [Bacteroidaceae bacterium]|nr:S-adenosylmethionine:tRNA ribosyltransferase-isomerase [Bacteroidaceae bacterium]